MKKRQFDLLSFSKDVKKYRSILNIGLRGAAKQIGTTAATLCRIENGRQAEINTVLTICDWMNITIEKYIKFKK